MNSDPIDLISPTSMDTNLSENDDKKIKATIAATTKGVSLRGNPSTDLRDANQTDIDIGKNAEFKPPSTESDNVHLKSFKDYRN